MPSKKIVDPLLGEETEILEPIKEEVEEVEEVEETPKVVKQAPVMGMSADPIEQTREILKHQEHVNFIVPMASGEKPGAYETVQINGYKLTIQKGVMVSIPKAVANLIANKYRINMEAGSESKIDRDAKTSEALS
jgi:hypothetical protein